MCTEIGFRRAILIARWLADRQQGTVARRQLLERGISATVIHRLVARGFLISVHRGVYLVGHRALARYAREMAAALACGRCAVVSHRSAASMLELLPYPAQADVWISVRSGDRRFKPGIRVYRATLEPNEVGHIDGVPVTSPARTIFDLAAIVDDEQLEGAVASGRVKGLVRESDLSRGW